jgi:hypothetical protein
VGLAGVLVADDVTTVLSGTVTSGDTPLRGVAGYVDAVTLVSTGVCTIRASQAGNANFNPAPDVERSFAVVAANTLERLYLPVVRRS